MPCASAAEKVHDDENDDDRSDDVDQVPLAHDWPSSSSPLALATVTVTTVAGHHRTDYREPLSILLHSTLRPNLEVARLTRENAEHRARLADAQADRNRWHANPTAAIERYNHDMQEMRGVLGREQVIALSATSMSAAVDPNANDAGDDAPRARS